VIASLSPALASEADSIKAINESSNALDKAFVQNDKAAIKALMTPDHISVTPYYVGRRPPTIRSRPCPSSNGT